jgi:GNAT superfamily N-acetyltransferase
LIIRPAVPDDVVPMRRVVEVGFETYREFAPPGWEPPDEARWDARSREEVADPSVLALIAEIEGKLAGHVRLVPAARPSPDGYQPDWHLRHLFVLPQYWGAGVAKTLHDRCRADLDRRGGTARLFTPADHARARRFYEREGWTLRVDRYLEPELGFDVVEYRYG